MNCRPQLVALALGAAFLSSGPAPAAQTVPQVPATTAAAAAPLPGFEVATIRLSDPRRDPIAGFVSQPGGRVSLQNATVKTILWYAFNIPAFRISGGPSWVDRDNYTIEALPPDTSSSRNAKQSDIAATPSDEQREMLQRLLADRFALKAHTEVREGEVYFLTRSERKLQLEEPQHADWDSRGNFSADGQAFGQNLSMTFLADMLSMKLGTAVVDQTGLTGHYDFHLAADDATGTNYQAAILDAMHRLGLDLKRGKGSVETLVIDHIERPTEN